MDIFRVIRRVKWNFVKYFSSVSGRLFFYTVIPSALITIVLCALYSTYLLEYHNTLFVQKGQVDFYRLQPSLQYGVYKNHKSIINTAMRRLDSHDLNKITVLILFLHSIHLNE